MSTAGGREQTDVPTPEDVIYEAVVRVRDASPRQPDDADSWDVTDAVVKALRDSGYTLSRWTAT